MKSGAAARESLLVAMPFVPNRSSTTPRAHEKAPSSALLLVAMPFAPSSVRVVLLRGVGSCCFTLWNVSVEIESKDDADEIRRLREELEVLALDFCFGTRFTRMHALQICKY